MGEGVVVMDGGGTEAGCHKSVTKWSEYGGLSAGQSVAQFSYKRDFLHALGPEPSHHHARIMPNHILMQEQLFLGTAVSGCLKSVDISYKHRASHVICILQGVYSLKPVTDVIL